MEGNESSRVHESLPSSHRNVPAEAPHRWSPYISSIWNADEAEIALKEIARSWLIVVAISAVLSLVAFALF